MCKPSQGFYGCNDGLDRAALAEPVAEPPAVAERPSDEELRDLWIWAAGQDRGPWPTQYHCFARAVLARWGQPPAPPAERHAAPVPLPALDQTVTGEHQ